MKIVGAISIAPLLISWRCPSCWYLAGVAAGAVRCGGCYWAVMVKPDGRPAAITVGDAAVTGAVTCGFPAASL